MTTLGPQEWGRIGWEVMTSRHSSQERREWAKRGGRKSNPTLLEIRAAEAAKNKARTEARKQARKNHGEGAHRNNVIDIATKKGASPALSRDGVPTTSKNFFDGVGSISTTSGERGR